METKISLRELEYSKGTWTHTNILEVLHQEFQLKICNIMYIDLHGHDDLTMKVIQIS